MTIEDLIATVLDSIRSQFYAERPQREFLRDRTALIRAISKYGHECNQRGWHFDARFILHDIMKLLVEIRTSGADIDYLPLYLSGAVKRHIGQRAEELSAKAKTITPKVSKIVHGVGSVSAVVQSSDVEVLAKVYAAGRRPKKQAKKAKQEELFAC